MRDKLKIERINEDRYERIFVFSDLHGSLHLFDEMIKKISLSKDDLVIILGDSCDRGKDSIGLYMRYLEMINARYGIKHIMGNHEYMFLNCYLLRKGSMTMEWGSNGGYETVKSIIANELHKMTVGGNESGINCGYIDWNSGFILRDQIKQILKDKR